MKETSVEEYLVGEVAKKGWRAEKIDVRGKRNRPDRMLVHARYPAIYVELKAPGKGPTKAQKRWHDRLRDEGYEVYTINEKCKVRAFLQYLEMHKP